MNGIVACLFGRIGQDAGLRYTAQGTAFTSVSVAVEDSKRDQDSPAEWCRVTVWGDQAEELAPRLVKGTRLYAEGRVKLNQWMGNDGQERSGLSLSAWTCQPIGQIGRRQPWQEREPSRRRDEPSRTPTAAGGWAGAGSRPWGGAA